MKIITIIIRIYNNNKFYKNKKFILIIITQTSKQQQISKRSYGSVVVFSDGGDGVRLAGNMATETRWRRRERRWNPGKRMGVERIWDEFWMVSSIVHPSSPPLSSSSYHHHQSSNHNHRFTSVFNNYSCIHDTFTIIIILIIIIIIILIIIIIIIVLLLFSCQYWLGVNNWNQKYPRTHNLAWWRSKLQDKIW